MAEKIGRVLQSQNPQDLQHYVKMYLSNDPDDLQRICKQLSNYQTKIQSTKPKRALSQRKSPLTTRNKFNTTTYKERHTADFAIKRCKKMMRVIQDRLGVKARNDQVAERKGMILYEKKFQKITKPLKSHPDFHLGKNPAILRQIIRYYVNKDFYENNIEDAEIDTQANYDKEMKQFIERRKTVLSEIMVRKNSDSTLAGFTHVSSKFLSSSMPKLPKQDRSTLTERVGKIFQDCDRYRSECYLPKEVTHNHYAYLKERAYADEVDEVQQHIIKKVKLTMQKELYVKYDNSYIKMMSLSGAAKCKLNKHQKDLLKNEIKMRNIINFSEKNFRK